MEEKKIETIDEYIMNARPEVQAVLQKLRSVIREAAPGATEKISWRMPTFTLHGILVQFAAFKHHIGLYPGLEAINTFENESTAYKGTKGSLHLPIQEPLPYELVSRIVKYRVAENTRQAEEKLKKKK